MQATAIEARNSLDYVAHVFTHGEARRTLVGVRDARHVTEVGGVEVDQFLGTMQRCGWYSTRHDLIPDDLPAQVTFTSGTEGRPKAIVLSYANQADTAGRIIDVMGLTGDVREYVAVPVTYSFGMGRFRAISAVGGSAYLSPHGFDPLELARMLEAGEVNALSAVPTLLRILLGSPEVISSAGRQLRWLEIGSQYMSAGEKRRTCELFPNARIVQHYGLTEASRSTFLDVCNSTDEQLESVGQATGNVEVGIDERGCIRIRGPHVARWRVDAQGLHALCDPEGWLQTNDLGQMRGGYLSFDGRADDLINCGGIKVMPEILEDGIRARLGTGVRLAVARIRDEARGEAVLAVVEGGHGELQRVKDAAAAAMSELGIAAAGSLHVRQVAAIPLTATGKPRRREIAADFETEQAGVAPHPARQALQFDTRDVRAVFQHVFPGAIVKPGDTFETLGGDSLRYIQFSMHFERRFGRLPDQWQSLSVSQLQDRAGSSDKSGWRSLEPSMIFRAMAMVFIVARHTTAFVYSRNYGAGILLFALGGFALARFQLPEIIRKGSVRGILGTALMVAIPTVLVAGPTEFLNHAFEPWQFLLISNFFDPQDPGRIHGAKFYFAEIYVQLFVLAAILFSIARVRALFRDYPMASALCLCATAFGLKALVDALWDTHYLFQRVPQNYAWTFCLGILVGVSRTLPQRVIALSLVAICGYALWGFEWSCALYVGGLAAALFMPALRVPALVQSAVGGVGAASMFIYLVHLQVNNALTSVFGERMPWIALFAALAAGIVIAYLYGIAQRLLARTAVGRRFFGALAGPDHRFE